MLLFAAGPSRRTNHMLAALVTLVPLGVFVIASVNPSSWAFTSAALLWAAGFEFGKAEDRWRRWALGALVVLGILLAGSSRAVAVAYSAVAVLLAWFANARRDRRTVVTGFVAVVLAGACVLWYRSLGQSGIMGARDSIPPDDSVAAWLARIQQVPALLIGSFGTPGGLGWLDTAMPSTTWVVALSAYAAAVFWGLRRCRWRKAVSLVAVAGLAVALPLMIMRLEHSVGQGLQPRYLFPLLITLVAIALVHDNETGSELHVAQATLLMLGLAGAHSGAIHTNLRRYVTGLDVGALNLNYAIEWWWQAVPSPMTVWAIASISFGVAAAIAVFSKANNRQEFRPRLSIDGSVDQESGGALVSCPTRSQTVKFA